MTAENESSQRSLIVVVQARMGSSRFPGKVLADLAGRPMLQFLLDRLVSSRTLATVPVVVATSTRDIDDPIVELCDSIDVSIVRGSEQDVLGRFAEALERFPAAHVVRITADCPLTDPALIGDVVDLHMATGADYTSNVFPRTFPKGLDVEVVRVTALREAIAEADDPVEREHVTPYVYRRPERFRLANLRSGLDLGDESWTVDEPSDLEEVRRIVSLVPDAAAGGWTWRSVLEQVGTRGGHPHRCLAGGRLLRLRPACAADSPLVLAWRNDDASVRTSATGERIDAATHDVWMQSKLDDPGCRLLIAEVDGKPSASVRVDVVNGIGTVSVAVAPDERGRGVGTAALSELVSTARRDAGIRKMRAQVSDDNDASLRAFAAAGFQLTESIGGWSELCCEPSTNSSPPEENPS